MSNPAVLAREGTIVVYWDPGTRRFHYQQVVAFTLERAAGRAVGAEVGESTWVVDPTDGAPVNLHDFLSDALLPMPLAAVFHGGWEAVDVRDWLESAVDSLTAQAFHAAYEAGARYRIGDSPDEDHYSALLGAALEGAEGDTWTSPSEAADTLVGRFNDLRQRGLNLREAPTEAALRATHVVSVPLAYLLGQAWLRSLPSTTERQAS